MQEPSLRAAQEPSRSRGAVAAVTLAMALTWAVAVAAAALAMTVKRAMTAAAQAMTVMWAVAVGSAPLMTVHFLKILVFHALHGQLLLLALRHASSRHPFLPYLEQSAHDSVLDYASQSYQSLSGQHFSSCRH